MNHKFVYFFFTFFLIINLKAQQTNIDSIITEKLLFQHVSALADDSMGGRQSGTKGNILAANYIIKQFEEIGISKVYGFNGYKSSVVIGNQNYGDNIIGVLPSTDTINNKEIIIFSAHYDHIGKGRNAITSGAKYQNKKDKIYNGANDNATGVAAMLAIAKYYKANPTNHYTILFMAFTGEEYGMYGSADVAGFMQAEYISRVINLEMLGRPVGKIIHPYITGGANIEFLNFINNALQKEDSTYNKIFFISDQYLNQYLFMRSDNYSFNKKNIDAITIMLSSPTDEYYHSVDDEVETIDFKSMQKVVKAIAIVMKPFL